MIMSKLTVGKLRKALEGVPDDLEIDINYCPMCGRKLGD